MSDAGFALAPGFATRAAACGLKADGALDLALVIAEGPASGAGVFTTNRVQAAPVLYDREALATGAGALRAVLANAGCANACTGERGMADARASAALVAARLGCEPGQVLVLSTGVIGRPLDMDRLAGGVAALFAPDASADPLDAARAILTTDTRAKTAAAETALGGARVVCRGFAKGAGMIHPQMATMLAVLTTDAAAGPELLRTALARAVRKSFNRISVDGDRSTNDTVLLLASGASGARLDARGLPRFTRALTAACVSLARQIARDGEGATRLVEIEVTGAASERQAHAVADSIARSPLVKTAVHGGDPNWGRVLAAAGYSGEAIDPARLALAFGAPGAEVRVAEGGTAAPHDPARAAAALHEDPVRLRLELGLGRSSATVWTCDLSAEYVAVNAHYTT